MKTNIFYIISIIIALTLIIFGIVFFLTSQDISKPNDSSNQISENNSDNNDYQYDINDLTENVQIESDEKGNHLYYETNINDEGEIFLFSIMTEEQINDHEDSQYLDTELILTKDGTNYYFVTGTGASIDVVALREKLQDPNITEEEKESLQNKLDEYNKILEIFERRDEIIQEFKEKLYE